MCTSQGLQSDGYYKHFIKLQAQLGTRKVELCRQLFIEKGVEPNKCMNVLTDFSQKTLDPGMPEQQWPVFSNSSLPLK